jgi:uncharacterized phage protein (TIGR01671 family)
MEMREIKYRAWSKSENLMGEVTGFRFSKSQYPFVNARFRKNGKTVDEGYHFGQEDGRDSVILMQFTGLYDKNGREIYEGDIVTGLFNHTDIIGHIVYGSDATFFIKRKGLYGIGLNNAEVWLEVVGNIYENPELLKEVK